MRKWIYLVFIMVGLMELAVISWLAMSVAASPSVAENIVQMPAQEITPETPVITSTPSDSYCSRLWEPIYINEYGVTVYKPKPGAIKEIMGG